jgi:hypothetical protein
MIFPLHLPKTTLTKSALTKSEKIAISSTFLQSNKTRNNKAINPSYHNFIKLQEKISNILEPCKQNSAQSTSEEKSVSFEKIYQTGHTNLIIETVCKDTPS